jgi:hypothetical protein
MKTISLLLFLLLASWLPRAAAKEGTVQCANLIYAGTKTSRCFSDEFLSTVQQKTTITTERRFKTVKLDAEELFQYPLAIITGEGDFQFTPRERENLKKYLTSGGFLLSSAGCSNKEWDAAFRREMKKLFEDQGLKPIPLTHPVFRTVYEIKTLPLAKSAGEGSLEGVEHNGKLVVIYSQHGLNDTHHSAGCCCCGGNEIGNAIDMNVNIVAYALLH